MLSLCGAKRSHCSDMMWPGCLLVLTCDKARRRDAEV